MTGNNVVHLKAGASVKAIVPETLEDGLRLARYIAESGLAPHGMQKPEQILVAIMHGMEIGLPPMQAIQKIAVIKGRPAIWGDAIPALLWSRGFKIEEKALIRQGTDGEVNGYQCTITRPDGFKDSRKFTEKDAKDASLWDTRKTVKRKGRDGNWYDADNDSPWYRYPRRMLQMRARGLAARDLASDVLMGLYLAEEAQDIPEDPIDLTPQAEEVEQIGVDPHETDDKLVALINNPCFEPGEHRPIVNAYKKEGGEDTWHEVTGAINSAENREVLAQIPDLFSDELMGMPWSWAGNARDQIKERWMQLEPAETE